MAWMTGFLRLKIKCILETQNLCVLLTESPYLQSVGLRLRSPEGKIFKKYKTSYNKIIQKNRFFKKILLFQKLSLHLLSLFSCIHFFKLFSMTPFNFSPSLFPFPAHIFQVQATHDLFWTGDSHLHRPPAPRIVNVPLVSSQMAPPFSFSACWSAFPKQFNFLLCVYQSWIFFIHCLTYSPLKMTDR